MKVLVPLALLLTVTWSGCWLTVDQRAQRLFDRGEFTEAAETFTDPMRAGIAWYRAGEFERAEQSFARLGTAEAEFNRGNCLVMRGKYRAAIQRFDRALELRPGWEDAQINREIAAIRADRIRQEGGDMGDQKLGVDEVIFDRTKKNSEGEQDDAPRQESMDAAAIQSLWLRRVQTSPAEFLKAKFAYQRAAREDTP